MTIIFFGSDGWFSPPILAALLQAGHEVGLAVTRGKIGKQSLNPLIHQYSVNTIIIQAETPVDVSLASLSAHLSHKRFNPKGFNLSRPEAIVLAAFGPPFLPPEVLKWPKYGALNVHASLLPRWRGASPVYAAIAAGDPATGVSVMRMTEKVDRGPILGQKKLVITFDTRETLTRRLARLGGQLIVDTLGKLEKGEVREIPQPAISPTPYTRRLTKDSGRIDWSLHSGETRPERSRRIERFIRAVAPWPGAWTEVEAEGKGKKAEGKITKLKILRAHLDFLHPSSLIPFGSEPLRVEDLHSSLVIDEVQLPGKNPISWQQFMAGHHKVELNLSSSG